MSRIDDILAANAHFADTFEPGAPPNPRIALVLCMDARIDPIRALGLPYGSAHIIRNAGGRVQEALRSLAVSQAVIGTDEVAIIHHTECAMATLDDEEIAQRLVASGRGVPRSFPFLTFGDLEQVAREDLAAYRASPLVRQDIPVRNFIYDVATGRIHEVRPDAFDPEPSDAPPYEGDVPELRGSAVVLRPLVEADFSAVLGVLREPSVARWWGHYDAQRVREEYGTGEDAVPLAIEVAGKFAGLIQFSEEADPDYRHASIDIALGEAYQRQGHGPDAIRTLARHLFEVQGHHRLTIDPAAHNTNAIRAYETVGFRRVGLMHQYERAPDGTWHDGLLMDLLAGDLK